MSWHAVLVALGDHVILSAQALICTLIIGLPLGVAAAYTKARQAILAFAALARTIPSLALLTLLIPSLGIGTPPAVVALFALALAPVVINADAGLRAVPSAVIESGRAMGLSSRALFWRISVPLSLGFCAAGVRLAALEIVAGATLATFVGAGGLGDIIINGLQTNNDVTLMRGVMTVALLALATDAAFSLLARKVKVPQA